MVGLLHLGSNAQAGQAPALSFDRATGLDADGPWAFIQDRQGFIWMGTTTGLYRYDGYRSTHYQHDASSPGSLPSDIVTSLLEDKHGRIWVATRDGVARFEPQTGLFTPFLPPPAANGNRQNRLTRSVIADGEDGLWFGTRAGLLHFNPVTEKFTSYRHDPDQDDTLPSDNVSVLAHDAAGGLWVGNWPTGLAYLAKGSGQFQRYALDEIKGQRKLPSNPRALHVDRRQRLWIGTDSGLFVWQSGTPWASLKRLPPPPGIGEFRVFSIHEDRTGSLWIGTMEAGLLRWDENEQEFLRYSHHIDDAHSLPANAVSALLVDRSQTLWVGTQGGGISRSDLASHGIEHVMSDRFAIKDFKAGSIVLSFAEDGRGNLWVGGTGGLALINLAERKLLRGLRHQPEQTGGLSSNDILHLYQQPDGPLWIGTSAGLGRLDPNSGRVQTTFFEGSGNNSINRIVPGRNGTLWLATGGGVIRYAPKSGTFRSFRHDPSDTSSLGPGPNSALLEDRAGNLWVGGGSESGARGLAILEQGSDKFRHYHRQPEDKNSLSSDIVTSIYQDDHGAIWLGTPAGLNRASRAADGSIHFSRYTAATHVSSIQSDLAGNIWANTSTGLSRLDPETREFTNYAATEERSDGTPLEGASFRGQDGRLYFGSLRGFTVVKPDAIQKNTTPPQLAFTDISVFNQSLLNKPATPDIHLEGSVTEPQRLQLSWRESVFSLEFSALHYADPAHNRFAYRLDGFDKDWVETTAEHRLAVYTNLNPGKYLFRVKAASNNGVWSGSELSLPITITPPFWKTPIFLTMLVLSVLMLVVLIYNWRVRQLTRNQAHLEGLVEQRTRQLVEKERAKTRFLASASHDLRQPIQAISLFLGVLKLGDLKEAQRATVAHLDASVEALRGLLNSLLDISKLDAGAITPVVQPVSLNHLMETLTLELSPLALDKKLRFKWFCPHQEITLNTDPQLLKVALQNLLSNAITYSARGGLLFAARLRGTHEKYVSIQVWDTGIGIGEGEQSKIFDEFYQIENQQRDRSKGLGLGLSIVKRTLALLELSISCRSRVGRGTVFEVLAPISSLASSAPDMPATDATVDSVCLVGKRFVVIEDDAQASAALCSWLQSLGGEVIVYASAESALADTANVYSGDYYLSDYRLPGTVSGLDFLKAIRTRSKAPCVLITGDTSSEFIEMTQYAGIRVLFKPVVPEQLLRMLSSEPPVG